MYLALYNPISRPYSVGYTLTVRTSPHCLNGCSGHGACGESDGKCQCQDGFTGPDCSVNVEELQKQGCVEGTLRGTVLDVPGGKAYSVCVCDAPAGQCAYTDADAAGASLLSSFVACDSGFELKGATAGAIKLSDGRALAGGGSCSKFRRGTSGGMVFFWCVFSVLLFCGAIIGGKHGMEKYAQYRSAQVGGYAEVAGEGGNLWDAFTGARRTHNNDSW